MLDKPKPGNSKLLPDHHPRYLRQEPRRESGAGRRLGHSGAAGAARGCPVPYDGKRQIRKAICDNYVYIPKIGAAAPITLPASTSEAVINENLLKGVVHYPGTALTPAKRGTSS
ncbi:MAG: hypothetical protein WKG07_01305 [Hymenobacter sp.]